MKAVRLMAALAALAFCSACLADDSGTRDKIWGNWKSGSDAWELTRADDGKVHITFKENGASRFAFDCTTVGTECKTKAGGHDATFSMYFNGDRLVQWERSGKETIRRRFHVSDDGSALEVESTQMSPPGKPEVTKLSRADVQEAERARQASQGQIDRK